VKKLILSLIALSICLSCARASEREPFDEEEIKAQVSAKFTRYNGIKATIEDWDEYFLDSPNIGNIHDGNLMIGWQTFHEDSVKDWEVIKDVIATFSNIQVFPINSQTAWATGDFEMAKGDDVRRSRFFDALIKTEAGWKVIMSYVQPITP